MTQKAPAHAEASFLNVLENTLQTLVPLLEKQTYLPGLYIIPTPIGNIGDISLRALYLLPKLSVLYAEDTRHTGKLLERYGLRVPINAYHDHNDHYKTGEIMARIKKGELVGLVSDAGMPLISDPGYPLLKAIRDEGLFCTVLPGASAGITALAGAGLPSHAFTFLGFLPQKQQAREAKLRIYQEREETLIFYEAPDRLHQTLQSLRNVFGARTIVLARELTKQFEEYVSFSSLDIDEMMREERLMPKGEMVILVEGAPSSKEGSKIEAGYFDGALLKALSYLSLKDASALLSSLYDVSKHDLYERGLLLKNGPKKN